MKQNKFLLVALFLLFAILFVRYYDRGPSRNYSDFRVYHTTAVRFLRGEDIYSTADPKITPFKYSPMFALLISPLGFLPIHAASMVFFTINFILLILLGVFSKKIIAKQEIHGWKKIALYVIPLVAVFRFALLVLDSGQANLLMVVTAILGIFLIENKKDWESGLLLAFSVMMKYVTFIFLPYFVLRGKWKAVFSSLAGLVFFSFLPVLFCGFSRTIQYLSEWMPFITKTSLDQGSWTDYKNQSIYSWVLRWLMRGSSYLQIQPSFSILDFHGALLVGIVLAIFLYGALLLLTKKAGASVLMSYTALFAGVAIFNPNCWPFNFVVLYFPVMALTSYLIEDRFQDKVTLVLLVAATILLNIGSQSVAPKSLQYTSEVVSVMTMAGLLVFGAALRINFLKPRMQTK